MPSVITDRQKGLVTMLGAKAPVFIASTGNITLTSSSSQTIDGQGITSASTSFRILVRSQTDPTQNGIYLVTSATWTRASDFNREGDCIQGTMVFVATGSTTNKKWWYVSSTGQNIPDGTSNITFASSIHKLQD